MTLRTANETDIYLVNRGGASFQVTYDNIMSTLEDTDLLLVNRGGISYSILGSDFKASCGQGLSPLPPFAAESTLRTIYTCADGKTEFSLDNYNWSTTLEVPIHTFYYVNWSSDIFNYTQGDEYVTQVDVNYPDVSATSVIEYDIIVDMLPEPFTFTPITDVDANVVETSNAISPLKTINAPTWVWGSSTGLNPQVQIGQGGWQALPAALNILYVEPNDEIMVRHTTGDDALEVNTTTLNMGYGTAAGEFESGDFSTTVSNTVVNTPTITSPTNGATDVETDSTITASPFDGVGAANVYKNTDWQLSTTSDYSVIVQESLADSSNVSTWTPTLDVDTTYYPRMRYRATDDTVSDWTPAVSFATSEFLPPLVNGSYAWPNEGVIWTVPADIGRVRLYMSASGPGDGAATSGGTLGVEFDVRPGEQFNWTQSVFGLSTMIARPSSPGDNASNGANGIFAVVGEAGATAPSQGGNNDASGGGGIGGYPNGGAGANASREGQVGYGGGGGTQSSGGAFNGQDTNGESNEGGHGGSGGGFLAAGGCRRADRGDNTLASGGNGGFGWYGGGGGGAAATKRVGGGGGGGSSHISVPNFPASLGGGSRNASNASLTSGDSNTRQTTVTY